MVKDRQIDWVALQQGIDKDGFFVVRSFLDINSIEQDDVRELQINDRNHSGAIQQIPVNLRKFLTSLFRPLLTNFRKNLNLHLSSEFAFCAIRVSKTDENRQLNIPFNYHTDPVVDNSGALNWHLDHYSYYLHKDYRNYLICYIPIVKSDPKLSNVAIVPKSVLRRKDPLSAKRISKRGACRFRQVEEDTIEWFNQRFPTETVQIGDWFAIDDFKDDSPGWKCEIDFEKDKTVPCLNAGDLLIMTADLIHKTNDAAIDRISIRCDLQPASLLRRVHVFWQVFLRLRLLFGSRKAAYNLKKISWLTHFHHN